MIAELLESAQLWRNPVFLRFRRSRLRLRSSIFWYLLTLIVASFVVTLTYILSTNGGMRPELAARELWIPLLIIQGLILMIKGTGSAAAGLIQDKIDQTLDYQRLTPLSPLRNLLGYLFGLPVLEYAMFALTLPHLMFIVWVGRIPLDVLLSVYLVFFSCAILYHMTGIATGMVMRRWIWGYVLSIFLVAFLNLILPTLISQFGLRFLEYLSIWPVIGQKILPLLVPAEALARVSARNIFFSASGTVPFYEWSLSAFLFTLLLQGSLIATFVVMALRRWKSSTRHSLSKAYALAFLCGFIVLLMGTLWPAITGQYLPFSFFGEANLEDLRDFIAIGLPLVYVLVTWLLCLILFAMVIPSHDAFVRGIRRAMRFGRSSAHPWNDDSASFMVVALFTAVVLAGYWVLMSSLGAAGFFEFLAGNDYVAWRLPLALGLIVVYTALLLQVLELKPTMLAILLLWFLPILVATVFSARIEGFHTTQSIIASLSPLALVVMSALVPLRSFAPAAVGDELAALLTGIYSGFVFLLIQIAVLGLYWHGLRRGFYRACGHVGSE